MRERTGSEKLLPPNGKSGLLHQDHTKRNGRKRAAKESPTSDAGLFSLSWTVQWCGSFPIGRVNAESITKRLDNVLVKEKHTSNSRQLGKPVLLSVSLACVSIKDVYYSAHDDQKNHHQKENISSGAPSDGALMSHSLRKILCVVGRVETQQLAYITREQSSHSGSDVPYRKLCHVFRTDGAFEVEEIETVLSNAFQRASSTAQPPTNGGAANIVKMREENTAKDISTPIAATVDRRRRFASILQSSALAHKTPSPTAPSPQPKPLGKQPQDTPLSSLHQTPVNKRSGFLDHFSRGSGSRRQLSCSSTLFQRLFGSGASSSSTSRAMVAGRRVVQEGESQQRPQQRVCVENGEKEIEGVRFRRPRNVKNFNGTPSIRTQSPATVNPIGNPNPIQCGTTPKSHLTSNNGTQWQWHGAGSRKRRPVSAVFGQAVQRLSSASTSAALQALNSWGSGIRGGAGKTPTRHFFQQRPVSTPFAVPDCILNGEAGATCRRSSEEKLKARESCSSLKQPSLVFDEKLCEWIYPIDDLVRRQLDGLAYFCKNPDKELVYARLRAMPEGAFVLRLSGSRKRCLALTIHVPEDRNPIGVAHYLIVRNEHGFRIKGSKHYFSSIPMLVTHHTVISEQLPCRLVFADWESTSLLKSRSAANLSCLDTTIGGVSSCATARQNGSLSTVLSPAASTALLLSQRPKSASTIPVNSFRCVTASSLCNKEKLC